MKLHPEDPRLTAFVLGELGEDEAAAVEQAIAADEALRSEVEGIRKAREFLTTHFEPSTEKLLPAQRANVRRHARQSSHPGRTKLLSSLQTWLIPAAAAVVLMVATAIFFMMSGESRKEAADGKTADSPSATDGQAPTITPPPAPKAPTAYAAERQGAVSPTDFPTLDLPVSSEKSSLEAVTKSIRTDGKLPPHEAVRLEQILNNFTLRLNGTTSIARPSANTWNPDQRDETMPAPVATLSSELIACPWKPSAALLLISLRGNPQQESAVKIAFRANHLTVLRYRLLGFNPVEGGGVAALPAKLPAGAVVNLAVEIEPSVPDGNLGTLEWSAGTTIAPPVSLVHNKDKEPSDDARFAALVCTFSQWLAGEQSGIIDAEVVAALAREIASSELPPERAEFLSTIDSSLRL